LRARMGYVKVQTETPGVAIYLNGKPAGKVTPAQLPLAEGQYEVGVEIDGQKTQEVSRALARSDSAGEASGQAPRPSGNVPLEFCVTAVSGGRSVTAYFPVD
jgi:hypothetical protein